MSISQKSYSITPKVLLAGRQHTIKVKGLYGHSDFKPDRRYRVSCHPAGGHIHATRPQPPEPVSFQLTDSGIVFDYLFKNEQEYVVLIHETGEDTERLLIELRLYALEEDLFCKKPYKGDTHLHTTYSDGTQSPAFVAAACRAIGLDFMAITDHRLRPPSLEAIEAMNKLGTDLKAFPGEEVHSPDNSVHIVNFGGSFSVNELFATEEFDKDVKKIMESLTDLPEGVDSYTYASSIYCFDKIREAGGLGIFCHPYWMPQQRYDVPEYLIDLLYDSQPWDALEVLGGYVRSDVDANTLAVARYHEARSRGQKVPIVGASDSHTSIGEIFGWYYTIVFSETDDLADLISNVKNLYSVAVEAIEEESVRPYGPFRLVKYSHFLLREVFPEHDNLCRQEGDLMLAALAGDTKAEQGIVMFKNSCKNLYDTYWSK